MNGVRRFWGAIAARWRQLSTWSKIGVIALVAVAVIGFMYVAKNSGAATPAENTRLRSVQVASVSDLENDTTPLPLIGLVQSVSEAEIRAQAGGRITKLYRSLGDYVSAGAIIAEVDNAGQRAALLQAEGALENAQASVQKGGKLFSESKASALDTIRSVYSSNDDLIRSNLDVVFSNPTSPSPKFVLSVSDQSLLNKVQSTRLQIAQLLVKQGARAATLSESSDLRAEITTALEETRTIKAFVDDVSALLNVSVTSQEYTQAEINALVAVASGARTAMSASLAKLTGASQALISAQTGAETPSEASAASATLKQAQGAVDAAKANLENTIIRAPISGTLNSLSIKLGDFVSGFQQVAVVSNNSALQIIANITPEDRTAINVGSKVRIEGEYDGTVVSIAPAVDPTTKKIELKVGFAGNAAFTNGESVHLGIVRSTKTTKSNSGIALPLSAVKIGADSTVVFSVDSENKLVAHTVKTGALIGDKIQILEGVTEDMMLVVDARGLKDGQSVDLQ